MRNLKVCVVHDGNMDEKREKMVKSVIEALSKKYDVIDLTFDENFISNVKNCDVVFNLSTSGGKDSRQLHVPAILDFLGIPYTGSSAVVHAICLDKITTKIILKHYGIRTPDFFKVDIDEDVENTFERMNIEYPLIVKPSKEGSAVGLRKESVVWNTRELRRAVRWTHDEFKQPALVEEFIEGKELSVGIVGNGDDIEVLPILEIDFSNLPDDVEKFYSYRVKNEIDHYLRYHCPARMDESTEKDVVKNCVNAYKVLGLRDYARMDVRIKNGEPYILEVNSLPLLVPVYSDITKMAEKRGYGYGDFVMKILETAMKRVGLEG